jgi:type IV secretion system protein VirB11
MIRGDATLRRLLTPFAAALARPDVREIVVNTPGRFGVEGDDGWTWHDAPELDFRHLDALGTLAASRSARRFGTGGPTFTGVLPDGERIAVARPPATPPGTIQINIRSRAKSFTPTLEWLAERGYFNPVPGYGVDYWRAAILAEKSILVCGAIGSSKTTFAEALLRAIPLHKRIVTIEGSPEWFNLPHENWAPLYFDGTNRTATDCIEETLRKRPDWAPFQEVIGREAWGLLRVRITGHATITTIHAENCRGGPEALATMARQSDEGRSMPEDVLRWHIKNAFHIVAHCSREPFRVDEVWEVPR